MDDGKIQVLDHGYIKVVETWGSDERIIESARMSTGKGFLGWGVRTAQPEKPCPVCDGQGMTDDRGYVLGSQPYFDTMPCRSCGGDKKAREAGDEKLLRFLYENKHSTPFEFAGMVIEVQAPIFVFREWHRHRTQSYNEMSARYTPLPDVDYRPSVERCMMVQGSNKQAQKAAGAAELTHEAVLGWLSILDEAYALSQRAYQHGLDIGIPKELARLPVPVARYSRMRASTCLRNWLAFLTLRSEKNPGAQWEIRQFGNALGKLIAPVFPRTWDLFVSS